MPKFTYGDVVAACDDLSDAIVKLNESITFDPGDLDARHTAVPDYVGRCSAWIKMDTGAIADELEIVAPEPVHLISGAAKIARETIQGDKQSVAIAYVEAANACYISCKALYPFLPADKQAAIPHPPDVVGPDIKTQWKMLTGKDWPDTERVLERPPGDKGKRPPPPENVMLTGNDGFDTRRNLGRPDGDKPKKPPRPGEFDLD